MNPRTFLDVDPRTLHLPTSRRSGADPYKLQRQIARHGSSIQGMPTLEVSRGSDGELVINNGVTRATRVATLLRRERHDVAGLVGGRHSGDPRGHVAAGSVRSRRGD